MMQIKKLPLLFWLYTKRLYRKAGFVAMLAALVLLTLGVCALLRQESSMMRVALVTPRGGTAGAVAEALMQAESVVQFTRMEETAALASLEAGEQDAVWVLASDLDRALAQAVQGRGKEPLAAIWVREQNVFTNLTQEKLYAQVFPALSRQFYLDYCARELGADAAAAQALYDDFIRRPELVEFSYYNSAASVQETGYLVSPLRGLLAAIVMLTGLVCMLYTMQDAAAGRLDAVPLRRRWALGLTACLAGTVQTALISLAALAAAGLGRSVAVELAAAALYIPATAGFALLVGTLTRQLGRMASLVPVLLVLTLAACPILLNITVPVVSQLLPTYWYLTAVYHTAQLPALALYTLLVLAASYLAHRLLVR